MSIPAHDWDNIAAAFGLVALTIDGQAADVVATIDAHPDPKALALALANAASMLASLITWQPGGTPSREHLELIIDRARKMAIAAAAYACQDE